MEACLYDAFLIDRLNKVRTKLKGKWLIIFPDYTMLLNLRAKLKINSQRYRNKKDENLVLPKE